MMGDFGHTSYRIGNAIIDSWGDGPFTIRVGKRRFYFSDSDMFGPLLEDRRGRVLDKQPIGDKHIFWAPYHMWRKLGRKGKKVGRYIVCRWRAPRPGTYWKDKRGISHFVTECEYEPLGFAKIDAPQGLPLDMGVGE